MKLTRIVFSAVLRFVTRQFSRNWQEPSGDEARVKYLDRSPIGGVRHSQV